ncbi:MAG: prepilin-type N-terminal cleavage/methylation domain-containing protein [Candidatus Omnitrophica bacterium]|nr:prepilin-type N-terminal cleavage/methylation domain-containing protein [Candidatus Omnitrophota bacterium]
MFMNRKGFTLIELIMVIVLLGLLAIVAIPKYYDLQADAKLASDKGVVGGVRAGIYTYFAKNKAYPATLDSYGNGPCSATIKCFDTVLDQGGIQENWTKVSSSTYTGASGATPTGIGTCTYTVGTGSFLCA